MSKLLLHACCGPCTAYVNQWLAENSFEVKGFFYNPNIRPREEYKQRLLTMEEYAAAVGLKVIYEPNDLETAPGQCRDCYRARLKKTAQKARELGFDRFSTTLLISPYQKHDLLKQMGEEIGLATGVAFYYHDFRPGFRQGQAMAKAMGLYRQKYCGCGADSRPAREKISVKAGRSAE